MDALFGVIGILLFLGSVVGLVINAIRKKGLKKPAIYAGIGLALVIVGLSMPSSPEVPVVKEEQPKAQEEEAQPVTVDSSTPQEEVKTESEPIEEPKETVKKFDSGTYAVGNEIEPGLYKSEGSIVYWARLKGFSGSLEDIIANGNPFGSVYVEIKENDKGFQTQGPGYWVKVSDDYSGESLTTFSDGIYIVGEDIVPGTYKSDGASTYWARLKGFSGDMNEIIANGNPQGPEIVKISANDVGFQTSGGATWTKID